MKALIITPIIALWLLYAEAWCGSLIVMSLMELESLEGKAKAVEKLLSAYSEETVLEERNVVLRDF